MVMYFGQERRHFCASPRTRYLVKNGGQVQVPTFLGFEENTVGMGWRRGSNKVRKHRKVVWKVRLARVPFPVKGKDQWGKTRGTNVQPSRDGYREYGREREREREGWGGLRM